MAAESDLEKRCRLYAEKQGGRLVKLRSPGTRGFPDRLLILFMFAAFVEFKRPDNKGRLSPAQVIWHDYLKSQEIPCWTVSSYSHFVTICRHKEDAK